ncbi:MAG: TonB-dependent receptor [Bacteroidaceae bacterium]|nr:TonB-dependent receptor [Bacteroidaceae bacterium]
MKRKLMLLMTCLFIGIGLVNAQISKVTGTVISEEDGLPVVGASVLVKGTTVGTVTDMDGKFTLTNVPSSAKTLMVSFIGMKTQEVVIRPKMSITLKPDAEILDEVVVTAYGTSTKGSFTGSAAVMKADKLEKRQVSNVSQALAGAVAGVQIQSSNGQPGVSATIRVRGVGSINADANPLYVVDGVPFDGDLSSINTQDIESMTVLKDAASTALYGARGANGIIMITTKKGKSGKATVNFDAKWGANSRAIKNYDVLTSTQEYVEKAYQAIYNAAYYKIAAYKGDAAKSNAYANNTIFTEGGGGFGYPIYTIPQGQSLIGMDGKLNPSATLGYSDGEFYYVPDDWAKEMFSTNARQEYNASISSSTDRMSFYASFGYLNDEGVIDNSGFERFTGRLNADYQVYKWLKVGGNLSYANSNSRYPGEQTNTSSSGNAFFLANVIAPVYPIYVRDAQGNIKYNEKYNRPIYDYGDNTTNHSRVFMSISNPAGDLAYNQTEYLMDIMNFNWFGTITPIKGLSITARYGLSIDNTRYNDLGNVLYGQSSAYGGTAYQERSRVYGFDQQYVANYTFNIDEDHIFDITAGYDGYEYTNEYVDATGQNLYNPDSYWVNNTIDQRKGYGAMNSYATEGIFGRLNYNYKDTYIGSVSFRRDASSRFHPDNRWGNFWSGSAAWVISNEKFMEDVDWIDMLKLKASFGQQGNDGVGNYYAYLDQFQMTGANGVFSDGTLYYKGNPDLTWETSTSYNVGVDFALLNNRLNGSIEYFGRKSSDMLYYKPVAPIAGYDQIPMNVGSMTNSGLEIDLNYTIFKNKNFTWDINANATFIKNKINELHPDLKGELIDGSYIYSEGESRYRMYLVKYAGVDPATGEALYWAKDDAGKEYSTVDWSVASTTNKVASEDLLPAVYGGFGTSISAFGFDASIQCSYQLGGTIYDSGYASLMHGGTSSYAGRNWHTDIRNSWTPENPNTDVPRVNASDSYVSSTSDRWLTSSDYLSINNITVGYTLPQSLTQKFMVSKLRLFFAADNVALLSARKGLDPRQSYTTATTARYTPIRTISGGVNITF